ncbi:hypothetical protein [Luteibacter sp. CQ10]|uniref:hypothetical protein n=1 Tax=Luteibacter sp. CQ10 TaxID=2805821 RepID=UPI0034A226AA
MNTLLEYKRAARCIALLVIMAVTIVVYAGGLHGPFLLDDTPNLDTIQRWLQGRLDWHSAIDNRSGPLGRPVSMLTFLMDAARSGTMDPAPFKTTNLAIHLICGMLVYALCRRLFHCMQAMHGIATSAALVVAAWWLFLPLHVSTVLYVVQRMAQLSAMFILLSLITYVAVRQRMDHGKGFLPYLALWIGFPLLVGIGALAKENAILAFPLALLIEVVCFAPSAARPRPKGVTLFFVLTLVIPALVIVGKLALHPNLVTGGYRIRSFTLGERLLTEPRVLWSYVKTTLLPVGEDMGLFHDNYVISTGWLTPWTTAAAILAWGGMIALAVAYRRRYPLITLGIGFFLTGHLLESTVVPLEIYFEHRNYLPDLGILLTVVGAARALWLHRTTSTAAFRRTVTVVPVLALGIYAIATWVQASSWADTDTLFEMQASYNPTSPRLQATLGARAIALGDTRSALTHIALAEKLGPSREGMTATLWRFIAYCDGGHPIPEALYAEFEQRNTLPITLDGMRYWEELAARAEKKCGGMDTRRLAEAGRHWIEHDSALPTEQTRWRSMFNLSRMDAISGNLWLAEADARRAWIDSDHNNGIGVLLFQLNATLGRREACEAVLAELRRRSDPGNADLTEAIAIFSKALADGTIRPAAKPSRR